MTPKSSCSKSVPQCPLGNVCHWQHSWNVTSLSHMQRIYNNLYEYCIKYIYDFAFERQRSALSKLEWQTWMTLWNSMKFIRRSRAPGWVDAATVCCLIWDVILESVWLISLYRTTGVFASVSRQWCIKTVRLGRWTAFRCLSSLKPSGGESVWVMASSCAPALETSTNMMASKTLWVWDIKNLLLK